MKHPQVVVLAFDEWLGKQLRELAAESRWLVREVRQPAAALALLGDGRPTVLVAQADPHAEKAAALAVAGPVPRLRRPAACVSCAACALGCPADAVRLGEDEPGHF